jgi:hypothetical protein
LVFYNRYHLPNELKHHVRLAFRIVVLPLRGRSVDGEGFWCLGRGPLRAKRSPLSHLPIRPPRVAAVRSKLPCEVAYKALATARTQDRVTYDLQVYFPSPRDARRTRAPASLGRPSGGDTLRASGEARAAYLERPIHPTTDKHLHQPFSSHFI